MAELTLKKRRPLWYNLSPLNLPLPGLVSIFHRVSGVALFVGVPWLLYLLEASLSSPESFESFKAAVSHPFAKLCLIVLAWSYLHHFCAGIRYLAIDLQLASSLARARSSSKWVLVASLALTATAGVWLW